MEESMTEDEGAVRHPSMPPPLPEAEDGTGAAPTHPEEFVFSLPDAPSHDAGAPLPEPVAPVDPVVRRGARLVAAGMVVLVLVSVGVGVGWLLRSGTGSDLDHSATGLTVVVGEAPVTDPGDEPVVAIAEAVTPSVVLVIVPELGQGSGIALDGEGHVVTNAHVLIDEAATVEELAAIEVRVVLPSGRQIAATVIGADIRRDVAVLALQESAPELAPATFASSDEVRVGQLAVAVGSPFGLTQTVTSGIVSAIGRVVPSFGCNLGRGQSVDCAGVATIQTDAPINPGNSGGPLVDRSGRIIGMNTSIRTNNSFDVSNAGVGFALPSDTVIIVAERLLAGEPVGTAWLGIVGVSTTDGRPGARIEAVEPGSPADVAGLETGDLIVTSDGRPLVAMDALRADIQLRLPGMTVELQFERDGVLRTTEVELGSWDDFVG
ncbi:MAG: trypsin-like peptidase domain-containing protein [Actinomycetota bacterium]|nr:trypsin-like peptidase domain-containing protein [Actinomycetota bacterium]